MPTLKRPLVLRRRKFNPQSVLVDAENGITTLRVRCRLSCTLYEVQMFTPDYHKFMSGGSVQDVHEIFGGYLSVEERLFLLTQIGPEIWKGIIE